MKKENKPLYLFIVGPTASGKSQFALQVAQKYQWSIINCDSLQVYKKTDIGTAKPSQQEMQTVPHYLFDFVEPPKTLSAADYIDEVKKLVFHRKEQSHIFVGGSGFYVQALEKGLYPNSKTSEEIAKKVKKWISEKGFEDIYAWIENRDPEFAKKISVNDHYRIRRTAEVMMSQTKTMSQLKEELQRQKLTVLPSHEKLKIGFRAEKSILRERVQNRTQKMLSDGFIEEVKGLLEQGLTNWPPLRSVGYKEIQMHLSGEIALEALEDRITTATMQLIKKQMTWFKRDSEIQWFDIADQKSALDKVGTFFHAHCLPGRSDGPLHG